MSRRAEKVDLSPLDPARDEERWERRIAATIEGVRAGRVHRHSVSSQLRGWARPALMTLAALVGLAWTAPLTLRGGDETTKSDPAALLTEWAANDELPATDQLFEVLGEDDHDARK